MSMREIELQHGTVRALDRGAGAAIVITPDCPSVIEHYEPLIDRLVSKGRRVICFDLPGFGRSRPSATYDFGVKHGAELVLELLDVLDVAEPILAFTCANGYYAMRAAAVAPTRIRGLMLGQTPSTEAMFRWGDRNLPPLIKTPRVGQALMRALRRPAIRLWYRMAVAKGTDPKGLTDVALRAIDEGGTYRLADMVQGLLPTTDDLIEGVTVPTRAVWGIADRSHKRVRFDSLTQHIPHALITEFSCGHFPDLERPEEYARLLIEESVR